jgi:hypothetical protein
MSVQSRGLIWIRNLASRLAAWFNFHEAWGRVHTEFSQNLEFSKKTR